MKATKLQTERKTIKNSKNQNKTKYTKAFSCTLYVPDIFKHKFLKTFLPQAPDSRETNISLDSVGFGPLPLPWLLS